MRCTVACDLCPNSCTLRDEELSPCRTCLNRNGKLYAVSYDSVAALHRDPISKGPLYHFRPVASTLSVATAGCNLHCLYYQNWELSQKSPQRAKKIGISQADLIGQALKSGCGKFGPPQDPNGVNGLGCNSYDFLGVRVVKKTARSTTCEP